MREYVNLNSGWLFSFDGSDKKTVSLPHTWNAKDGQDGGADYKRGIGVYVKRLKKEDLPKADRYYLEFEGANSVTTVFINGKRVGEHRGGYSTFRFDITQYITEFFEIRAEVDNSHREDVYPQMADFTFYGGLYRDVNLICVAESHFSLDMFGGPGIAVTPKIKEDSANIDVRVYLSGKKQGQQIVYTLYSAEGSKLDTKRTAEESVIFKIDRPHLWHGRRDPYLYTVRAELFSADELTDMIETEFGCRDFNVDPQRGFILNGEEYPLRGVSRHQDRKDVGNALLDQHHDEDMSLILDVGANTVRLAHYQQDGYFYSLCDRNGIAVWAEIPYISRHMDVAEENTLIQLKELIIQNYNHPSIFFWGLSNEITMNGSTEGLLENHKKLNDLAHELDKTRLTAIACVSMCDPSDPYINIPDVVAYNHYFGWYGGDTDMNGPWFDKFHKEHPDIPIGVSEYGCEALNWHSSEPHQGDYTEEYQAYYHEQLIKQLFTRPYLFATYVWNMFDFGADARSEGGENGQNHKGLVSFDRKYKKDAYYAYRAWLSDTPFVHICGKRYVDRAEKLTRVTVYSNLPMVELFINGRSLGKKRAADRFFKYEVPLDEGENRVIATAGRCRDESLIRCVDEPNPDYILKEAGAVLNWFDIQEPDGCLSLNSKISDIINNPEGAVWFETLFERLKATSSDADGFTLQDGMTEMLGGFTLLRMLNMLGIMNISFTKEELLEMNDELNKIKIK